MYQLIEERGIHAMRSHAWIMERGIHAMGNHSSFMEKGTHAMGTHSSFMERCIHVRGSHVKKANRGGEGLLTRLRAKISRSHLHKELAAHK